MDNDRDITFLCREWMWWSISILQIRHRACKILLMDDRAYFPTWKEDQFVSVCFHTAITNAYEFYLLSTIYAITLDCINGAAHLFW